ncbi:MAG: CaiB/BaiF CoA transferase family protein [Caulobacteraceae bacterium]
MAGALHGVKIADFSWVGAGPRATKDLADNGALVVKIESRKRLDLGRVSPPFKDGRRDPDGSAFFAQTNTSKKSVTINLGEPRGVEVAKALVAWADVVVENFSKGYLDRLGLSFADMRAINPDVILVSVSVAGRSGPLSGIRGYGNSAAALSGQASLSGWDGQPPHMPPFAYGDVVAPMFATVGVLAALEHRRRTGEGQHVDVSQVEPLMHTMADLFLAHAALGPDQAIRGNRAVSAAPHGAFPCRGKDQWCAIACESEAQWRALVAAADLPALAEPRFATIEGRKQNEDALDALLSDWTLGQDKHVLADRLRAAGVPAGAVQDGRDVFTDPELIGQGHYVRVDHPVMGASDMPAPPMRFSRSRIEVGPAPLLGQHNREVFVELLGLDAGKIAELEAEGVLA